jgi:putative oxidoreductase
MGSVWSCDAKEEAMRRIINNDYLTLISRLLIGGMMIYASYYKIIDPGAFAKSIWFYHLVPGKLINLMALILPWLELICGLALIFGYLYRGAVLWSNVLLVVFIVALSSTIVRGINIDCGCFKAAQSGTHSAWNSLIFDLVAFLFSIQLFFSRSRWLMLRSS